MEYLEQLGLLGLFIGSFLAATVIPFSSEVLLVALLSTGANLTSAIIVATMGNWLGSVVTFYMGYFGKWEWIEKYFKVKHETLLKHKKRIDKYGAWLALFSWLPIIGEVISLGLGFYRVSPRLTIILTLVGKGIRFIIWAIIYTYARDYIINNL